MYNVTQAYKEELAGETRGPCYAELDLCRLDGKTQAGMYTGFTGACVANCVPGRINDMTAFPRPAASFEPDWLRVDGSQIFVDDPARPPPYYISQAQSADSAQTAGYYPITGQTLTTQLPGGFPRGMVLTWQFDGALPASLSWYLDADAEAYGSQTARSGIQKLVVVLPEDRTVTTISVRIASLIRPYSRLRVTRLYAGQVDNYTGTELLSLKFSDSNDGIGLELPERKLAVSLRNTRGLTAESEYLSPTYRAADTQAVLRIGMEVQGSIEWLPMGRFFLSEYQVDEDNVDFIFRDALGLLSQYIHHWAGPASNTFDPESGLNGHIDQVLYPVGYDAKTNRIPLPSPGRDYGLKLQNIGWNMTKQITAPCPRVSCADALRLYASVSGNLMRGCRADYDLTIRSRLPAEDRLITLYELYARPVWQSGEAIRSIDIEQRFPTYPEVQIQPLESGTYTAGETYTVYGEQEISSLYYKTDGDWSLLADKADMVWGTLYAVRFTPKTAFTGEIGVEYRPYSTAKAAYTPPRAGQGENKTLSNPLIGWTEKGEQALEYGALLYDELSHSLEAELSHRGFPELGAGDIIRLQMDEKGTAPVRVLENTVEIKAGAMSGKTRVRLMQ